MQDPHPLDPAVRHPQEPAARHLLAPATHQVSRRSPRCLASAITDMKATFRCRLTNTMAFPPQGCLSVTPAEGKNMGTAGLWLPIAHDVQTYHKAGDHRPVLKASYDLTAVPHCSCTTCAGASRFGQFGASPSPQSQGAASPPSQSQGTASPPSQSQAAASPPGGAFNNAAAKPAAASPPTQAQGVASPPAQQQVLLILDMHLLLDQGACCLQTWARY